ncbi:hypothetical protein OQA88_11046 [Cercophora sp. LCS_1]
MATSAAELERLCGSLSKAVASLRGLCEDAQKEDGELVATAVNVVVGLEAVRGSLDGIWSVLAGKEEGEEAKRLKQGLGLCVRGCWGVVERLEGLRGVDESDWESVAESVRKDGGCERREDIVKRVEPTVESLGRALDVLVEVLKAKKLGPSEQWARLENSEARGVFKELEMQLLDFAPKGKECQGWGSSLLRPFRLNRLLGGDQSKPQTLAEASKLPLARSRTWPTLTMAADPEAQEARQRSAQIDRQIEADSMKERTKCSIMLTEGSHENKVLLMETFALLSSNDGNEECRDLSTSTELVRGNIYRETQTMVEEALHPLIGSSTFNLNEEDTEYELAQSIGRRLSRDDLSEDLSETLTELWSSPRFRHACRRVCRPEAHDNLLVDAFRRAMAEDYVPTLADYRRFLSRRHNTLHYGTFNFGPEPLTLSITNNVKPSGNRGIVKLMIEEAVSFVFIYDLVQCNSMDPHPQVHEEHRVDGVRIGVDPSDSDPSTLFKQHIAMFQHYCSRVFRRLRPSIIVIFTNVAMFRDHLQRHPMSELYPDYTGEPDLKGAVNYMINKLLAACNERTRVYPHVGEMTDVATVKFILAAVKESMLHSALRDCGLC